MVKVKTRQQSGSQTVVQDPVQDPLQDPEEVKHDSFLFLVKQNIEGFSWLGRMGGFFMFQMDETLSSRTASSSWSYNLITFE